MAQVIIVRTNHHWRPFLYRDEVPAAVLSGDLDWTDADDLDGYFCYRGAWYHLGQFMRGGVEGWDGAHGDSYFSGVVIKLSADCERYMVGTYYSADDGT